MCLEENKKPNYPYLPFHKYYIKIKVFLDAIAGSECKPFPFIPNLNQIKDGTIPLWKVLTCLYYTITVKRELDKRKGKD